MAETWTLDGLALNDGTTFQLREGEIDLTPPKQRPEWIGAADSEYQDLVRNPKHENRVIVLPLQIVPTATKDLAFDKVGQIADKLVKASATRGGIDLTWLAHGSARTVTFDVLAGEIGEFHYDRFLSLGNRARLAITLTCKPYWVGTRTLGSTTSSSTPFVSAEIVNNIGDVPALGELIVTDTATQSRRHVEWGLEGPLTYNSSTSLLIDSDNMVTSGFAGVQATGTGAYDPNAAGNSLIATALVTATVACCGTGNLSHVGSFRVKARVQATDTTVRLAWQAGDGPFTANPWVQLESGTNWVEVDLGSITVPVALSGTQRWSGRIEATSGSAQNLYVDYLVLVPTSDGYGKARAVSSYSPGVLTGFDQFTGTTSGSNLNARVATLGGTWATSGATTDFQFADNFSGEQVKRATVSDVGARLAILGSSLYTDTEVAASIYCTSFTGSGNVAELGGVARYVDSSNYIAGQLTFTRGTSATSARLHIMPLVAGVVATGEVVSVVTAFTDTWYGLRIVAYASGRVILTLLDSTLTTVVASLDTFVSSAATGGVLDDGKPGLYDAKSNSAAASRYYDDFRVSIPPAEPIVLYSGRNMQFRYDTTFRQDSTGVYTGEPPSYHPAGRFLVPVGTSRVLVKARRNDVDVGTDPNVTDATQIQVGVTPRGLVVPRA